LRAIATTVNAMAGQTRDFILNAAEMEEVVVALSVSASDERDNRETCHCCKLADRFLGYGEATEITHRR
jgi:hypothetical protein